ncbi:MAG: alpha/beta hydrolase family protein [Nannocystales bacterium]
MHGWLAVPEGDGPFPGLVWLHGAFAASAEQFEPLGTRFPPPGFAVFVPSWRGENGNPGERELLAGELDDAVAAVRWFAQHPQVDAARVFALGHSVGGALAALLALLPDLPLRETASVGGIYVPQTFVRWSKTEHNGPLVRFDATDPDEGRLRTLEGNVADLLRPHIAYVGRDDPWFHPNVERMKSLAVRTGAPFEATYVDGDHMSSLVAGYSMYVARLQEFV